MDYKHNRDRIVRAAVTDVLDAHPDWFAALGSEYVDFDYAEDEELVVHPTREVPSIIKALGTFLRGDYVYFLDGVEEVQAWIMVLTDYGSNPGECMVNYTVSLDDDLTRAHELSRSIMERWDDQRS